MAWVIHSRKRWSTRDRDSLHQIWILSRWSNSQESMYIALLLFHWNLNKVRIQFKCYAPRCTHKRSLRGNSIHKYCIPSSSKYRMRNLQHCARVWLGLDDIKRELTVICLFFLRVRLPVVLGKYVGEVCSPYLYRAHKNCSVRLPPVRAGFYNLTISARSVLVLHWAHY